MATITKDLVKKRAEHNDGQLGTLEEISLHQQDIVKIDNIQYWCKNLKILLLQGNLISKIENLWKLKQLEYLNLALNNIEKVENLNGCESLEKLDLMMNFIGDLESITTLKDNYNLKTLILVGNPCTAYDGYRDYVIAILPQLEHLDSVPITRSERIVAVDKFSLNEMEIKKQQQKHFECRKMEKQQLSNKCSAESKIGSEDEFNMDDIKEFWNKPSKNTPEERMLIMEQIRKQKKDNTAIQFSPVKFKRKISLFAKDGRPLNINEPKIPFSLVDDEKDNKFVLTVQVYKHIDTDNLDVDVQPWFVRVLINKKVLQLVLSEEVKPDRSFAERSILSKNLVITMHKLQANEILFKKKH